MNNEETQELAKRAALRSHARKSLHNAKIELMPHITAQLDALENLKALAEIIAQKNGTDRKELITWLAKQVFEEL